MKITIYIFSLIILVIFGLFYYEVNNSECYKLQENDAKSMINNILKSKHEKSNDGTITFGYNYTDLVYSKYEVISGKKGDGFNSVDLTYNDKIKKTPLLKVSIFENCGLHWYALKKQ